MDLKKSIFVSSIIFILASSLALEGKWARTFGKGKDEVAYSVQQTSDGGYVVAGKTESFGAGDADFWVLKLFPNGTVEWQRTYGGNKEDIAHCIHQTSDGGYIVAG